jgi:hypothetical protein
MDVTILSVTKRLNGVCVAGVNDRNLWIRPTKKEELVLNDIRTAEGGYISVGNTYEFHFSGRAPVQCQTENHLLNEYRSIKLKGTLPESERRKLYHKISENAIVSSKMNIADSLRSKNRSLVMLGPARLQSVYLHKGDRMKCPEISFSIDSVPVKGIQDRTSLLCTDLKFWEFSKALLEKRNTDSITMDESELKKVLYHDKVFIIIGLTKLYHGRNWPMIVGFHLFPDYRQDIDYADF